MSKVSILLPTFNRQQYIKLAIDSVLSQTYQDWELLISDNCSQDDTFKIANEYAAKDTRILCWQNEKNIGALLNYNKCIEKASGDYIELFGADDIFEPTCIASLATALDQHADVALVTSAKKHIDENGQILREDRLRDSTQTISSQDAIHHNLNNLTNSIISPVMFRSKYKGAGFDLSLGNCADLEYWTQILRCGNLFYINEILFNYRIHNGSETTRTLADMEFAVLLLRIAERNKEHLVRPDQPELLPYKIVIEKLMDIVDYSTNYLKLDFDPFLGSLGKTIVPPASNTNDDLHDFKRISYLSLLHAAELRKELQWLRDEFNNLQNKSQTDYSPVNKNSWPQHTSDLQQMRMQNAALQEQVEQLSGQLNSLLNSKSWKITAPLRMVMKQTVGNGN